MKRRMTKDGKPRQDGTNRRDFLKYSALATGYGVWVATEKNEVALAQQAANDRVNVAWVGVGGKGDSDSKQVTEFANLVAICDVDEDHTNKKLEELKKLGKPAPKVFNDWRKMFDEMGKEIDACGVSIPDHNHAIVTIHAMKLGKHVYTQKPLTHTVAEARMMREVANEMKIVSQMGNQGTATPGLRSGVEAIQAGAIGNVKEIHIWTNRPIWPQAPVLMKWPKAESVPSNMNWDVWLGPAPETPYNHEIAPFNWRGYWRFGTGAMGDMGCHTCNLPYMGTELTEPTKVKAVCADLNPVTYPAWATVEYEFPNPKGGDPIKVYWYEGHFGYVKMKRDPRSGEMVPDQIQNLPPKPLFHGIRPSTSGSLTVGDKGTLYSPQDYGGSWMLLPKEKFEDFKAPEPTLPRFKKGSKEDDNMKLEWINAIKGEGKTLSNFNYASRLVEFILLGNVANRNPGDTLEWDTKEMKFTNNEGANKLLKVEYREGWSLT